MVSVAGAARGSTVGKSWGGNGSEDGPGLLAEVPGLGESRIKALLRHFGSVSKLKQASPEEIQELPGIGPRLAASIHSHLATGSVPSGAGG